MKSFCNTPTRFSSLLLHINLGNQEVKECQHTRVMFEIRKRKDYVYGKWQQKVHEMHEKLLQSKII